MLTTDNFTQDQIDEITATFGAITDTEHGSNERGEWYKFGSGLLIQMGYNLQCTSDELACTRAYYINFPINFADTNINVFGTMLDTYLDTVTHINGLSIGSVVLQASHVNLAGYTGYRHINWIAVGRWE